MNADFRMDADLRSSGWKVYLVFSHAVVADNAWQTRYSSSDSRRASL